MSCCDKHAIWESFIVKNTFGYWKNTISTNKTTPFYTQNCLFTMPEIMFRVPKDNLSRPKRLSFARWKIIFRWQASRELCQEKCKIFVCDCKSIYCRKCFVSAFFKTKTIVLSNDASLEELSFRLFRTFYKFGQKCCLFRVMQERAIQEGSLRGRFAMVSKRW